MTASESAPKRIIVRPGEVFTLGRKVYGVCAVCDSVVCLNKRIFGGLHVCR